MTEQLQLRRGTASQVAAFTGAQGEVVVDTTNNRAVVNDGSTSGGWPAAKLAEVITNTRTAVADAAYSALATDRSIAFTALSAARTVTLPAAASYPAGTPLVVFDESGACSGAHTITLAPSGSDTIDGATSAAIASAYGYMAAQSNGSNKWTIVAQAGAAAASRTAISDAAYAALNSDRMIAYTALTAARIVTLPAAASYPTGARLAIVDESGACSATLTITVQRAGSDLIDGATSFVIDAAYGGLEIESNGANAWTILSPRPNDQVSLIGVGTAPDPANPLSVYGASALLNSATNFNLTINKGGATGASADTASLIFEDGFSGRAQMGLNGSDNFSFKVSPNGSSWVTAIALDATTGAPTFANQRTAVSDASYSALVTDRLIAYSAITAARTVSLPAAASYPPGQRLVVVDESGACSATKTITLARAGSDTINGVSSQAISTAYGFLALESNGAGAWTIVDQPGASGSGALAAYGSPTEGQLAIWQSATAIQGATLGANVLAALETAVNAASGLAGLNASAALAVANGGTGATAAGAAAAANIGALAVANNLSDVASATTARGNLTAAKSGANGDITSLSGLTTALSIAQGGSGTTAARTQVSDANYTALTTDRLIGYSAISAARTVTLPAAASYPAGVRLTVVDESGSCSATLTITLARAGSDAIEGATSAVIATPRGFLAVASNGSNAWTIVDATALLPANNLSDLNSAAAARGNLGLGSLATQAASAVAITGGSIAGVTLARARAAVADANYSVATGIGLVAYTAITAARIVTLPAASSFGGGQTLLVIDESGAASASNAITVQRAGSDTIDGATSATIAAPFGYVEVESNGANAWTISDTSALMTGDSGSGGAAGLVPAPAAGAAAAGMFLKASGAWAVPGGSGGGNVSNSGTPTSGQIAEWTSATTIAGVTPASLAFGGDSGSGGSAGTVPAPPANSAAYNEVLGAGGAWVGPLAGFRNRIVNGGMAIDQRNAGAAQTITAGAALAYTVDRFYGYCTGANVTGQQVGGSAPDQYLYKFTGAASVTAIGFGQRIETVNSFDLAGQTATFSVKLANSLLTAVTWTAYYATTADTFGTLASPTRTQIATGTFTVNSTLTKYSATIAIPSAATTGVEIVLSVGAQTSGTWQIGAVQLELGQLATAFERRPMGVELGLSARYYETSYDVGAAPGANTTSSGSGGMASMTTPSGTSTQETNPISARFAEPKRASPTVSLWDRAGNASKISGVTGGTFTDNVTGGAVLVASTRGFLWYPNNFTYYMYYLHWSASAEL